MLSQKQVFDNNMDSMELKVIISNPFLAVQGLGALDSEGH